MSRYLAGELTLRAFDEWFVLANLEVERLHDPAAETLMIGASIPRQA